MALSIGVNSWATIAEADSYLFEKLGSATWTALSPTSTAGLASKELYLIMAFRSLVSSPTYFLSASLTDDNVKYAQIELAFYFLTSYASFTNDENTKARGVTSFTYSKVSESFGQNGVGAGTSFPAIVQGYLTSYSSENIIVDLEVT